MTKTITRRPTKALNNMIPLGIQVAEQTLLGDIKSKWGVDAVYYKSCGAGIPATDSQQISKLRVFFRYAKMFGPKSLVWLAGWEEHTSEGASGATLQVYDTLLDEMRYQIRTRKQL